MTSIRFDKLSHIEFIPMEKCEGFNLVHRKGDPIVKLTLLRGVHQSRFQRYDQDCYSYWNNTVGYDQDFYHKEEVIERGIAEPEAFDSEGYIWEPWKVVLHFLDGQVRTKTFWNEAEAKEFYETFKEALPNEI